MFHQSDSANVQWIELAHMLKNEWEGQPIDRNRARVLAANLLPRHPELRGTLAHIQRRLG